MSIRPTGDGSLPVLEAEFEAIGPGDPGVSDRDSEDFYDSTDATVREFEIAFNRVKTKRLGVNVVVLKGLQRTKHYIVARELRHLPNATNLDELKDALLDAWQTLERLDIFEAVDIVIDEGSQLRVCCLL